MQPAAIGTALLPGIGTALGAVIGSAWLAKKMLDAKKDEE